MVGHREGPASLSPYQCRDRTPLQGRPPCLCSLSAACLSRPSPEKGLALPSSDGVASFLDPRHILLPRGAADDPAEKETVCSLGNRKNGHFLEILENEGVTPFASTVDFIKRGKKVGLSFALISASRNARRVLAAASLTDLFDAILDGENAARLNLAGKPAPDIFVEAAIHGVINNCACQI